MTADTTFELDQRTFRDGHVVLYKRPHLKNPKWQCRISVPHATGYVRRTNGIFRTNLKLVDLPKSFMKTFARKSDVAARCKSQNSKRSFLQFKDRYQKEAVSVRRYNEIVDTIQRYGLPFFKNKALNSINNAVMQDFMLGDETTANEQWSPPQRS